MTTQDLALAWADHVRRSGRIHGFGLLTGRDTLLAAYEAHLRIIAKRLRVRVRE